VVYHPLVVGRLVVRGEGVSTMCECEREFSYDYDADPLPVGTLVNVLTVEGEVCMTGMIAEYDAEGLAVVDGVEVRHFCCVAVE
jgi:hypothetical protein